MGLFGFLSGLREDGFEKAFSRVTKETTLTEAAKSLVRPILRAAYEGESAHSAAKKITGVVPEETWKWPAYDEQAPSIRRAEMAMRSEVIAKAKLDELLDMVPRSVLKTIYRELCVGKLPARHAEFVSAILAALTKGNRKDITDRLRTAALDQMNNDFTASPKAGPAVGSQTEAFVNRVLRMAFGLSQWSRIIENKHANSSLMLDVPEPWRAKPECLSLNGKPRSIDNECWEKHLPPCERVDCLCGLIPVTKRRN